MIGYENKELIHLTELGQYLKSVLEFCLIQNEIDDKIDQIKWNIQWMDLSVISREKEDGKEYYLELVIVLKSTTLNHSDKNSIIASLKNYFLIENAQPAQREINGTWVFITKMHDTQKERFHLIKGGKGIPRRISNYDVIISIESKLRDILPSAKLILSSDEIKNQEKKLIEELQKERSSILKKLDKYQKPIIICEGKSDIKIIETAWKKLYKNKEMPFQILPSGVWLEIEKSEGNADQIRRLLELYAPMNPDEKICIGLFDNDREGNEQYKGLNKKIFKKFESNSLVRQHKVNKIYGMLLPVPSNRSKYFGTLINHRRFVIEHYFSDDILEQFNMKGETIAPDSEIFEINGNKDNFSKSVNSLDKKEFQNFEILFKEIEKICS
ncbi:hypothetical protein [Aquimarina sediminis]|uniref:hypothetical protein n=1 Tax=Aquimarina sediminis TaxID=2070536 RepID=UPI000CA04D85|nr:hypothetical protein [Aquimarina sediminis]